MLIVSNSYGCVGMEGFWVLFGSLRRGNSDENIQEWNQQNRTNVPNDISTQICIIQKKTLQHHQLKGV
jgi:hypothetical protein